MKTLLLVALIAVPMIAEAFLFPMGGGGKMNINLVYRIDFLGGGCGCGKFFDNSDVWN
jgi:hypothetical protein